MQRNGSLIGYNEQCTQQIFSFQNEGVANIFPIVFMMTCHVPNAHVSTYLFFDFFAAAK